MASRIAYQGEIQKFSKATKPVKSAKYLDWIRTLPCVVTQVPGVQAAHVSFAKPEWGHFGRGKSQKASDRWALPLTPRCHDLQHRGNEEEFWRTHRINPHLVCLILWGLYQERGEAAGEAATRLIMSGVGR